MLGCVYHPVDAGVGDEEASCIRSKRCEKGIVKDEENQVRGDADHESAQDVEEILGDLDLSSR